VGATGALDWHDFAPAGLPPLRSGGSPTALAASNILEFDAAPCRPAVTVSDHLLLDLVDLGLHTVVAARIVGQPDFGIVVA
jgi:hypothetical protein